MAKPNQGEESRTVAPPAEESASTPDDFISPAEIAAFRAWKQDQERRRTEPLPVSPSIFDRVREVARCHGRGCEITAEILPDDPETVHVRHSVNGKVDQAAFPRKLRWSFGSNRDDLPEGVIAWVTRLHAGR